MRRNFICLMKSWMVVMKYFLSLILLFIALLYFRVVYYQPMDRQVFSGNVWDNPYEELFGGKPVKVNLHAHTHQWLGITNGNGEHMDVSKAYKRLGYDIAQTSEYNALNGYNIVPAYEHGFGLNKVHQLVLNAESVNWFEFPLFQWTGHKGDILHRIKEDNNRSTVVLAHPKLRNGYNPDEMKLLSGFDLIEVVSRFRISTDVWDSILVSGNPVYLLGSDDCHNVFDEEEVGRAWTWVWQEDKKQVVEGLLSGKAVGVILPYETNSEIMQYHASHTSPIDKLNVVDDTLILNTNAMDSVRFIVDGLAQKWQVLENQEFVETLDSVQHYVRVELKDKNGVKAFLNPIIRKKEGEVLKPIQAAQEINVWATVLYRLPPLLVILLLLRYSFGANKWDVTFVKYFNLIKRKRLVE